MAAQNALEIMRAGRLTAPYSAPYDVVHEEAHYRLRRYQGTLAARRDPGAPLVLVPPLMVASEIYDISPDTSAVSALTREGIDTWVIDFGAPEREEGGLERTLDDHVRAVSDAVTRVREATGRDVHMAGYSQGGMFAYQAAAYLRGEGLASIITFGSPVDIHRSVPQLSDEIAERLVGPLRAALGMPLDRVEGLPGVLTSTAFKMLSVRKEVGQMVDFVRKLHDRQELERREAKRLFLRGAGFVAWPGPALRKFVDEMIVANRMTTGGFVIDGRTLTLADIRCPILYFVGERDDIAAPAAVRAIRRAAPNAELFEVSVKAGHFGLVVGSRALSETWPTVMQWMRWRDGHGERPAALPVPRPAPVYDADDVEQIDESALDVELFYDVFTKAADALVDRVGDVAREAADSFDHLRYQVPRLNRLRSIDRATRVSMGLELAEQARRIGERTFFLHRGRAFSYADANQRVDNVVRGLIACGVAPGLRVGVLMHGRPSFLSAVVALNRVGAVSVMLSPRMSDEHLPAALDMTATQVLITDPENGARARRAFDGDVLVLGGGGGARSLPDGLIDMEAIDPDAVKMPAWFYPNPGRAKDLAMILTAGGKSRPPRMSMVTNHRWAFSALGAAATCTLTSRDTVYACLPLHHAAGAMVAAGSALVGGARLALAQGFTPESFWTEVRRYGATVAFYANDMCRLLVDAPRTRGERNHPLRLFAGSGMRPDVWDRLVDRFGPVGVLEFYASTETNAVLANASGEKHGSVGRPMPGSSELAIVRYDLDRDEILRGPDGRCQRCADDERGMLLARLGGGGDYAPTRTIGGVFSTDDTWYVTGDLLRRDPDGDYWYVDRASRRITTPAGGVLPRPIEAALYRVPGVALAVAYGVGDVPGAAVVMRDGATLDRAALAEALEPLDPAARPAFVRIVDDIPMTDGFRLLHEPPRAQGAPGRDAADAVWLQA